DVMRVVAFAEFVNGENVGVVEGRGRARLNLKTSETFGIRDKVSRKYFQCDESRQSLVTREINLAHAPAAESFDYFVRSNRRAGASLPVVTVDEKLRVTFERRLLQEVTRSLVRLEQGRCFAL